MSDDEGMNSAQGVPSENESDGHSDAERVEPEPAEAPDDTERGFEDATEDVDAGAAETDAENADAGAGTGRGTEAETESGDTNAANDTTGGDAAATEPETGEDVQHVLKRVTEYDDELARDVNAIVETARDLNTTVQQQREELEDLQERSEEQAGTIGDLQDDLEAKEAELAEREERIDELEGHVKRKQADFQNYKKRAKKRQEQLKARATEDLVSRLVGVRDNLKRALEEESSDAESLRDGVEMTMREFDRVLADENVEEIDPEPGTEVDPQRHEVMVQIDSAQPEGTIAEVFTPGYEMDEKVIQNAQVTVSNGELESANGDDDDGDDEGEDGAVENGESEADGEGGGSADADADSDVATDAGNDEESQETDGEGDSETSADAAGSEDDDSDEAIELGGEVTADAEDSTDE